MDFMLWYDSLFYPRDTFTAERDHGSFKDIVIHILLSGLIYGGIVGFIYEIFSSLHGDIVIETMRDLFGRYFLFSSIFLSPLLFLLILFFLSSIIYISARFILDGYGDFLTQSYLLSLLMCPLILISVIRIIPMIGKIIFFILLLYSIKPLLIALKVTHRYDTRKAIFTLISSIVLVLLIFSIIIFLLSHSGIYVFFDFKTRAIGFRNIKILTSETVYHGNIFEFSILNTMNEGIIIMDIHPNGDCANGIVDLNKKTKKFESFVTLDPEHVLEVKIFNCSKKFLPRGKFSVPIKFQYQEKKIGRGITHLERGIIEGLTS